MEDNKILKLVYTFFLGILLAIFVGAGVNTFYPGPKSPEYPISLNTYDKELTKEQGQQQKEFDQQLQQHNEKMKPYNRNVSTITLAVAVVFLMISILYEKRIKIIADGVMLGGLFTLLYGIGRGFASEDSKYVFLVIAVGLALVLYLGYHRFVRDTPTKSKPKKNK